MADVKEHCLDSKLQNLLARTSCFLVKTAVELLLKSRKRLNFFHCSFVIHHGTTSLVVNRCPLVFQVQQGRVQRR